MVTESDARRPTLRGRTVLIYDRTQSGLRASRTECDQDWKVVGVRSETGIIEGLKRSRPDAVAVSFDDGSEADHAAFESLREQHPGVIFVALLGPRAIESEPLRNLVARAFDAWVPLPCEPLELLSCVRCVDRMNQLRRPNQSERTSTGEHYGLHGSSRAIRALLSTIDRFKDSDASVLIVGETGTGKELVARAIHEGSARRTGPLIALNCGAISSSLIQAELFGHEKSAFTGAAQRRAGSFEAADRGSVFLDEIGELPLEMQPALQRVVQERSVTRLGSSRPVPIDFRLIAATHVDLPAAVTAGRFREDLLFRINVLSVHVPPLRDREDDVIVLAERFREEFAGRSKGAGPRGFSQDAVRHLRQYRWPGNVRELINRVQRAVLMADGRLISAADLGFEGVPIAQDGVTLAQARSQFERVLIRDALRESGHCMAGAARRLGVSRVTLYRMVDRLGLAGAQVDPHGEPRMLASRHAGPVSELKSGRFIS